MRSDVESSSSPPPASASAAMNGTKEDAQTLLAEIVTLKSVLSPSKTVCGITTVTQTRSSLQEAYVRLLLIDLEVALDEKVEQDLWNIIYKQPITDLQMQIRDRSNPNRAQAQTSHRQLLDQAALCYRKLLQELRSAYVLDLPSPQGNSCLHQGNNATFLQALLAPVNHQSGDSTVFSTRPAKSCSSCTYMYQHCLVHLGDVARYNLHNDEAREFYMWSATVAPSCGHPYNQLAILEASKNHHLASVFYYARSLACTTPFPAASSNLDKLFDRLSREPLASLPASLSNSHQLNNATDLLTTAFLQFHAAIHLNKDMFRARKVSDRLMLWFSSNLHAFTAEEMAFIGGIQLYSLYLNVHKKQASLRHSAHSQSSNPEMAWTRLLLQSTLCLIGALCEGINETASPSQSHPLPALLLLILWYRLAVREGYFIFAQGGKESTASNGSSNSLIFPASLIHCLNRLDQCQQTSTTLSVSKEIGAPSTTSVCENDAEGGAATSSTINPVNSSISSTRQQTTVGSSTSSGATTSRRRCYSDTGVDPGTTLVPFEDSEDTLDIAVISDLPEIQLLQGYLPLSIPPLAKPLSTQFSAVANGDSENDNITIPELRSRVLIEAARYISRHQPSLLSMTTSAEGHIVFSLGIGSSSSGKYSSGGFSAHGSLALKRPARPATASDPLELAILRAPTEERLPGQYPLPSATTVSSTSTSSTVQSSLSKTSSGSSRSRGPSGSGGTHRQTSFGSGVQPPSSLATSAGITLEEFSAAANDQMVRKSLSLDEGTSQAHDRGSAAGSHPGLIVNANIARFIQAQAAGSCHGSVGSTAATGPTGGTSSRGTSASSTPATTPTGGHLPTVGKRVHTLSSSSVGPGPLPMNGTLASPTSSSGGGCGPPSAAAAANSRHLYNQNREQFQKDLPPRFAAASIRRGGSGDGISPSSPVGGSSSSPVGNRGSHHQQQHHNGLQHHHHHQSSSAWEAACSPGSMTSGSGGINFAPASPTSTLMQVGMWDPSSTTDMGGLSSLARKESEPLFPNDPPPSSWYSSTASNRSSSNKHHLSQPPVPSGTLTGPGGYLPHHQQHLSSHSSSTISSPPGVGSYHHHQLGHLGNHADMPPSVQPLSQHDPNTLDRMQRFMSGKVSSNSGLLDHMLAAWPSNTDLQHHHKSHHLSSMIDIPPGNSRHGGGGLPSSSTEMPVIDHWSPPVTGTQHHHLHQSAPQSTDPISKVYSGNVQSLWSPGAASGQHHHFQSHLVAQQQPQQQQQQRFVCGTTHQLATGQQTHQSLPTNRTDPT